MMKALFFILMTLFLSCSKSEDGDSVSSFLGKWLSECIVDSADSFKHYIQVDGNSQYRAKLYYDGSTNCSTPFVLTNLTGTEVTEPALTASITDEFAVSGAPTENYYVTEFSNVGDTQKRYFMFYKSTASEYYVVLDSVTTLPIDWTAWSAITEYIDFTGNYRQGIKFDKVTALPTSP